MEGFEQVGFESSLQAEHHKVILAVEPGKARCEVGNDFGKAFGVLLGVGGFVEVQPEKGVCGVHGGCPPLINIFQDFNHSRAGGGKDALGGIDFFYQAAVDQVALQDRILTVCDVEPDFIGAEGFQLFGCVKKGCAVTADVVHNECVERGPRLGAEHVKTLYFAGMPIPVLVPTHEGEGDDALVFFGASLIGIKEDVFGRIELQPLEQVKDDIVVVADFSTREVCVLGVVEEGHADVGMGIVDVNFGEAEGVDHLAKIFEGEDFAAGLDSVHAGVGQIGDVQHAEMSALGFDMAAQVEQGDEFVLALIYPFYCIGCAGLDGKGQTLFSRWEVLYGLKGVVDFDHGVSSFVIWT